MNFKKYQKHHFGFSIYKKSERKGWQLIKRWLPKSRAISNRQSFLNLFLLYPELRRKSNSQLS